MKRTLEMPGCLIEAEAVADKATVVVKPDPQWELSNAPLRKVQFVRLRRQEQLGLFGRRPVTTRFAVIDIGPGMRVLDIRDDRESAEGLVAQLHTGFADAGLPPDAQNLHIVEIEEDR